MHPFLEQVDHRASATEGEGTRTAQNGRGHRRRRQAIADPELDQQLFEVLQRAN